MSDANEPRPPERTPTELGSGAGGSRPPGGMPPPTPPAAPPMPGTRPPGGPTPVPPPPYFRPPPPRGSPVLGCAFALSFLFNVLAVLVFVFGCLGLLYRSPLGSSELATSPLIEVPYSGNATSKNKVAVVQLDGVIMEGLLKYVHKEIDQAAKDKGVKAVVLHINSPGGSVGASDDLHRRLTKLRDGDKEKKTDPKPLVVSMGSLAASGGYYVAMPARQLFAEPTTITGSIGVYTSLPNVKELGDKIGLRMNLVKQGNLKDSGSPFEEMTPDERRVWQDFVNHTYLQFVHVVEEGRKDLKVGSSRVDLQACKLEYSIVSPK